MSKIGTTIRYEYNHDGLRTQKFVDANNKTDATYYTYNGKNIIHVIKNSDHLHIFYDAQNRPAKVSHNGIFYTYLYNLQGDVVGLVDKDGALVVEYKYDAWGKPLSITGTMADTLGKLNPFRYRGYVYDDETGLYYLHSRYYNPDRERFINADRYISDEFNVLGKNMYTYCFNCPLMLVESSGAWPKWAQIAVAAVAVVAVTAVCVATAGALTAAVVSYAGVMSTTGAMTVAAVKTATAVGGIICGGGQLIEDAMDGDDSINIAAVTIETMSGSTYGMVNGTSGAAFPIIGKWAGALGKAAVGVATALSRALREKASSFETIKKIASSGSAPVAVQTGIKVYAAAKRKWKWLLDVGSGSSNPSMGTLLVKTGGILFGWIMDMWK